MEETTAPVLEMKKISKRIRGKQILQNFDLTLEKGRIFGLVGENGVGKSMVLRIALGLERADEGDVFICGERADRKNKSIYQKIGYVPEHFGMYHNLHVSEYMLFFAQAAGMTGLMARKRIGEVLGLTRLYGYEETYVGELPASIRQRLCIAVSLLQKPKLILMDGPAKAIDSQHRKELRELYRGLAAEGMTLLVTSHNLRELAEFCTDIGLLVHGRLCEQMTMADLMAKSAKNAPIRVELQGDTKTAVQALRDYSMIKTISCQGQVLLLGTHEAEGVEKEILRRLIEADVSVRSFAREVLDPENYIMERIEKEKQGL